eukprot:TRINITY_DN2478_c0_g1_i1.p2 TRINITY_DN2478_c0_g1~~TRINITY_DN2478_c0_g1_i1.p2  ORF type:complete len:145 (-),score=24.24 TRINITY_DN2478_c0_g1_i1:33-467(-)
MSAVQDPPYAYLTEPSLDYPKRGHARSCRGRGYPNYGLSNHTVAKRGIGKREAKTEYLKAKREIESLCTNYAARVKHLEDQMNHLLQHASEEEGYVCKQEEIYDEIIMEEDLPQDKDVIEEEIVLMEPSENEIEDEEIIMDEQV